MIGGSSDLALMLGATETGFDPFAVLVDAADGGPQKRRRTREANRLAAEATAEAARLTKEANALAKMTDPSGLAVVRADVHATLPPAAPSLLSKLTATSPLGLPWWAVGVVGAVGVWAVLK
jgi:hypothetical protein